MERIIFSSIQLPVQIDSAWYVQESDDVGVYPVSGGPWEWLTRISRITYVAFQDIRLFIGLYSAYGLNTGGFINYKQWEIIPTQMPYWQHMYCCTYRHCAKKCCHRPEHYSHV